MVSREPSGIARNSSIETGVTIKPNAIKRLVVELEMFNNIRPNNFTIGPFNDEDPLHWQATFTGLDLNTFPGGVFILDIQFDTDHPYHPPKILNPKIVSDGLICFDFFGDWRPCSTISCWMWEIISQITL